ncbi:MAG: exodeoxyribonuclease VII large subunit [Longimonas sp.]|uniref:exodeoxyribonuclease VII large subunit n=1 Tax=Longimonas sp. TaxID=2039626 RepID=UPI0039747B47
MANLDLFRSLSDTSPPDASDTSDSGDNNQPSTGPDAEPEPDAASALERPAVHTVHELAQRLQNVVETSVGTVTVEGELSNFKRAASGHCYFSIKDEEAQLRCVMWRYQTKNIYFSPKDGQQVRLTGKATVYPKRGQLQLMATRLERAGRGAQQAAYERLKRTLKAEGLFDNDQKQPLPSFPKIVGVVTSGEGAAIEDIRSVLARRYPLADVVLCPVPVQGIDAPAALTKAIRAFSGLPTDHPQRPDVLIVGRGGGSAEDLWAFNEEPVARALATCSVPTISAVGHETDTSITDFVADRAAATPSMAAEIAVPDQQALRTQIRALHEQMRGPLAQRIRRYRQTVERLRNTRALHSPRYQLDQHRQHLDHVMAQLNRAIQTRFDRIRTRTETAHQRLRSADPRRPMQHGFALVTQHGEPVTRAADLDPEEPVTLRFRDGTRQATVHDENTPVDDPPPHASD